MRATLISLATLATIAVAAFIRAEPALCLDCLSGFNEGWSPGGCTTGCSSRRINGRAQPEVRG